MSLIFSDNSMAVLAVVFGATTAPALGTFLGTVVYKYWGLIV